MNTEKGSFNPSDGKCNDESKEGETLDEGMIVEKNDVQDYDMVLSYPCRGMKIGHQMWNNQFRGARRTIREQEARDLMNSFQQPQLFHGMNVTPRLLSWNRKSGRCTMATSKDVIKNVGAKRAPRKVRMEETNKKRKVETTSFSTELVDQECSTFSNAVKLRDIIDGHYQALRDLEGESKVYRSDSQMFRKVLDAMMSMPFSDEVPVRGEFKHCAYSEIQRALDKMWDALLFGYFDFEADSSMCFSSASIPSDHGGDSFESSNEGQGGFSREQNRGSKREGKRGGGGRNQTSKSGSKSFDGGRNYSTRNDAVVPNTKLPLPPCQSRNLTENRTENPEQNFVNIKIPDCKVTLVSVNNCQTYDADKESILDPFVGGRNRMDESQGNNLSRELQQTQLNQSVETLGNKHQDCSSDVNIDGRRESAGTWIKLCQNDASSEDRSSKSPNDDQKGMHDAAEVTAGDALGKIDSDLAEYTMLPIAPTSCGDWETTLPPAHPSTRVSERLGTSVSLSDGERHPDIGNDRDLDDVDDLDNGDTEAAAAKGCVRNGKACPPSIKTAPQVTSNAKGVEDKKSAKSDMASISKMKTNSSSLSLVATTHAEDVTDKQLAVGEMSTSQRKTNSSSSSSSVSTSPAPATTVDGNGEPDRVDGIPVMECKHDDGILQEARQDICPTQCGGLLSSSSSPRSPSNSVSATPAPVSASSSPTTNRLPSSRLSSMPKSSTAEKGDGPKPSSLQMPQPPSTKTPKSALGRRALRLGRKTLLMTTFAGFKNLIGGRREETDISTLKNSHLPSQERLCAQIA